MTLTLKDPAKLRQLMKMAEPEVSARRLATAAGYKSHTSVNRLLAGDASTVDEQAAQRIARYLQVELDFLFAPKASTDARRSDTSERAS